MIPKYPYGIKLFNLTERWVKVSLIEAISVTSKGVMYTINNLSVSENELNERIDQGMYFLDEIEAKKAMVTKLKLHLGEYKKNILQLIKNEEKENY